MTRRKASRKKTTAKSGPKTPKPAKPTKLRVIGGDMRGRIIHYHGEQFTRPMKDNIRENLFNILGPAIKGKICFDLFAGTGALAFESISRGASKAFAIERSKKALSYIENTAGEFGCESRLNVLFGDAFRLGPELLGPPDVETPWVVFLCPPYALWTESLESMNRLIRCFMSHAPPGSHLVAETEKSFDQEKLFKTTWDVREYGGTRLAFAEPEMRCGLTYDSD